MNFGTKSSCLEKRYFHELRQLAKAEEEEEDLDDDDETTDFQTPSSDVTSIRDVRAYMKVNFRGRVLWKKDVFTSNSTEVHPHGLKIARLRVGDSRDFGSFTQVTAFGESAQWLSDNIQEEECYEFDGLKIGKSNRFFCPLSHNAHSVFDLRNSSITKLSSPSPFFPNRMYFNFIKCDRIADLGSTCIEIIGVVAQADVPFTRGLHAIRKVVLVDRSLLKVEFYLWDGYAMDVRCEVGAVMILQGLKVRRYDKYVAFSTLRCKYLDYNCGLPEFVDLDSFWNDEKGSLLDFTDFPEMENPLQRFVDALAEYNDNAKKTEAEREILTVTSLAEKYKVNRRTLNAFFNSNGILCHQPQVVKTLVQESVDRQPGVTLEMLVEGTTVKKGALYSARQKVGVTKPQNPQKLKELNEKKNKTKKTDKELVRGTMLTVGALKSARHRSGESKKQNPDTVARAVVWLPHRPHREAVEFVNSGQSQEKRITVGTLKSNIYNAKKKYGQDKWQQHFRNLVIRYYS